MATSGDPAGMEFFFQFDNAFFQPFGKGSQQDYAAVGPGMTVANAFYVSQTAFEQAIQQNLSSLGIIGNKTIELVENTVGDWDATLEEALTNFGQGLLWDDRRNTAEYLYWAVHTMDSIAQSQAAQYGARSFGPSEYPSWYAANRGISEAGIGDADNWLKLGRYIAMAGAIQNVARPWCAVGPSQYSRASSHASLPPNQAWTDQDKAHNQPIPETVAEFCDLYKGLSQEELDDAFKQAKNEPTGQAGKYGNPLQVPADY